MFAFYLSEEDESINSQVIFGEPEPKYYKGKLNWHNVTEISYWQLGMEDIYINGESLNLCNGPCKLVIDTGTSIITAPSDDLRKVLSKIKLNNCEDFSNLPNIGFRIDEVFYTLNPEDYIIFPNKVKKEIKINSLKNLNISNRNNINKNSFKSSFFEMETNIETSGSSQILKFKENYTGIEINEKVEDFKNKIKNNDNLVEAIEINNNYNAKKKLNCRRAFMPLNVEEPRGPLWVLGDLFLRKYFVVFDRDNKRIGISLRNSNYNDNKENINNSNKNKNKIENEIKRLDMNRKIKGNK